MAALTDQRQNAGILLAILSFAEHVAMALTIKLDPNFTEHTVDLAALGYEANDVVLFAIKGGYRNDGAGKDNYWSINVEYGATFPISKGLWEVTLVNGLDLTFANSDPTIGTNTDPNKDFKIVLQAGLFSGGNNVVDFNNLTTIQAQAIKEGQQMRFAWEGNDTIHLPDKGTLKSFDSSKFFFGDGGNDTIYGGNRNDKIDGWTHNDTLYGGDGKDQIWGETGADHLYGDAGNDKLFGNAEMDNLTGGTGADWFCYFAAYDSYVGEFLSDWIHDFSQAEHDRIDLERVDANTSKKGNQAFSFIGDEAFSGKAGELHFRVDSGVTYLEADLNGSGSSGFTVRFDDEISFVKGDFIL
jgi:Ca2+-binding RTX toxin-like protein